jgi:short-subunit dehydrogenase
VNLDGRSVLLTGATGGIGQAIARALAARGARLVLTGRRAEVLEPLVAEVGGRAVACDLASADEVSRLLGECSNADVLVANAALPATGVLESFSVEEIDRALDVNLRAPIVLARALSKGMVARSHGHLVFVSSLSGKAASARGSIYSATKFGLRGFALGLREDLRDTGVGVSTVFPGFISDAGMFHESGAKLPGYVAMKTPEDVAAAVVRAIERNRAEIDVAPLPLRLGTAVASLLPELSGRVQRRLGSLEIAESMAEGQRDKR